MNQQLLFYYDKMKEMQVSLYKEREKLYQWSLTF